MCQVTWSWSNPAGRDLNKSLVGKGSTISARNVWSTSEFWISSIRPSNGGQLASAQGWGNQNIDSKNPDHAWHILTPCHPHDIYSEYPQNPLKHFQSLSSKLSSSGRLGQIFPAKQLTSEVSLLSQFTLTEEALSYTFRVVHKKSTSLWFWTKHFHCQHRLTSPVKMIGWSW